MALILKYGSLLIFAILFTACGGSSSGEGPPETASVKLSWDAPTTRTNDATLNSSEISGFKIYSSRISNSSYSLITTVDGNTQQYTVGNLESGTHYFFITAIDLDGKESPLSNLVEKTL